jgi:DNA-binding transcriptional regulator LsrR (DeoR family)
VAKRRLSVRKIKEVLRLHHEKGFSTRQIAKCLSIGRSTVQDYLDRSERAEIDWFLAAELDETSLEQRLYPSVPCGTSTSKPIPAYLNQKTKGLI